MKKMLSSKLRNAFIVSRENYEQKKLTLHTFKVLCLVENDSLSGSFSRNKESQGLNNSTTSKTRKSEDIGVAS